MLTLKHLEETSTENNPSSPTTASPETRGFTRWLYAGEPAWSWHWRHLQEIRLRLARVTKGELKRLAISTPPQHGKTSQITVRYPLWRMMRTPGLRVLVGTHSDHFGHRIRRWMDRVVDAHGLAYGAISRQDEFDLANGSTCLIRGAGAKLSGLPVDLAVIEDPYGSAEDARSEAYRTAVLDWYEEDILGRLQSGAPLIIVHTRWRPDDLIGIRLETEPDQWEYLPLPALAGENDPLGRSPGEALCPDRFTAEDLESKRVAMRDPAAWESLYQCNPLPRGGSFIQREWLSLIESAQAPWNKPDAEPPERVRYWDLAGTKGEAACYTAGVLLARHGEKFYVENMVRGRWVPADRNAVILETAKADMTMPGFRKTYFEQEPGSSGLETAERLGAQLAPFPCEADKVTGDKDTRLQPFADQCRLGNVFVLAGPWNHEWLAEITTVPQSRYRDASDSTSGAFNRLTTPEPLFLTASVRRR